MIKRHSKEPKVLEFLKEIGKRSPVEVYKGFTLCNPKLYAEMHSERLKNAPTQKIYDTTIAEVAHLKRLLDEREKETNTP